MKKLSTHALSGLLLCAAEPPALASGNAAALNQYQVQNAQPGEVAAKVRRAAALLAERGPAGLDIVRNRASEFSWKDTYVFVVNCGADEVLANPAFPERQGGDIKQHTDYNGKQYGLELCETAQRPGGGWVEYVWLKPGGKTPLRKFSFVMSVEGQPYQVGAGIYDQTLTLEEVIAIAEMSH